MRGHCRPSIVAHPKVLLFDMGRWNAILPALDHPLRDERGLLLGHVVGLSACRSPDPIEATRRYIDNYEHIVRVVSRIDAGHAHQVAAQAFRSDEPLQWAWRYLKERQRAAPGRP